MKSLILLFLLSFNAYGASKYAVVISYQMPIEREDGELIKENEISSLRLFEYDCATGKNRIRDVLTLTYDLQPGKQFLKHYVFSDISPACFRATVTDSANSSSDLSELIKGYDFRTIKPVECLQ